jgi:hypothetical protein
MTDRVDAVVDAMEVTALQPSVDLTSPKPKLGELTSGHHPMLTPGQQSNVSLPPSLRPG